MHITPDDLTGPEIRALLETHFAGMLASSHVGSCHFLDFEGLKGPGVSFWSVWTDAGADAALMGCGAVKELDPSHGPKHGEIKSMRTHADHLRKGAAAAMLEHIIATARERGLRRLSLETGSTPDFDAAPGLYRRYGFEYCPPVGDYVDDPFSRYMTLVL